MKRLLLLGFALLVIAISVVAATTIKASDENNPKQLVVHSHTKFIYPDYSASLPEGECGYWEWDLFPEGQWAPKIGESMSHFVATEPVTTNAAFSHSVHRIFEEGDIFVSSYHYGWWDGTGVITGGTGAFRGASGEYSFTPCHVCEGGLTVTFNFDRAYPLGRTAGR